jgi:hypothetical protein
MTRPHYHVGQNIAGYLPDSCPDYCATRKSAEDSLRWHRDSWLDFIADTPAGQEPYTITGSIRSGHLWVDRGEYTIPIHLWIEPCTDDCDPEQEW